MGKQFPNLLLQAGLTIEKHADHFADIAKDEEWLTEVGRHGWYAITHDQRIRYKPNEKAAVNFVRTADRIFLGKMITVFEGVNGDYSSWEDFGYPEDSEKENEYEDDIDEVCASEHFDNFVKKLKGITNDVIELSIDC